MKQRLVAKCYDKRGNLLSIGKNNYNKSHPLQAYFAKMVGMPERIYLHAEIDAILRAKGKRIHSIHVARYDKHGRSCLAKPCQICQEAIKAFGIQEIIHT